MHCHNVLREISLNSLYMKIVCSKNAISCIERVLIDFSLIALVISHAFGCALSFDPINKKKRTTLENYGNAEIPHKKMSYQNSMLNFLHDDDDL